MPVFAAVIVFGKLWFLHFQQSFVLTAGIYQAHFEILPVFFYAGIQHKAREEALDGRYRHKSADDQCREAGNQTYLRVSDQDRQEKSGRCYSQKEAKE